MQSLASHTRTNRWFAIAIIAIAIGGLLLTYWQSSGQLISRTTSSLEQTCAAVQRTVSNLYPSSESKQQAVSNPELLYQAISESIRNKEHTLGGFWHIENGFMGYAVASSRGNSQDSQLAGAVQLAISSAARKAIADNKAAANVTEQLPIRVVVACPEKQHAGLAIWLSHPIQPVQNYFSVTASVLFVLLALIGVAIIVRGSAFNRRWHKERDRIVNDAEDTSKAVSVTSEIGEIQPFLLLLYQARQQVQAAERELEKEADKLRLASEKTLAGRMARSMAALALSNLENLEKRLRDSDSAELKPKVQELVSLFETFSQLSPDMQGLDKSDLELEAWLQDIADYHESFSGEKNITVTSIVDDNIRVTISPLVFRFVFDFLLRHVVRFIPVNSEVLIQANIEGNFVNVSVCDESNGVAKKNLGAMFETDDVNPDAYGVGLKVIKDAIKSQGGDINYEKLEKTSRFNVLIPMTKG